MNWDRVRGEEVVRQQGSVYAFGADELPPVNSFAYQIRYFLTNKAVATAVDQQADEIKRIHERLGSLRICFDQLITSICTDEWTSGGVEYRELILSHLSDTLFSLFLYSNELKRYTQHSAIERFVAALLKKNSRKRLARRLGISYIQLTIALRALPHRNPPKE